MRFVVGVMIFVWVGQPAARAADVHSYARPEHVRARHVDLDLEVDFDRQRLRGQATLTVERRSRDEDQPLVYSRKLQIEKVETSTDGKRFEPGRFEVGKEDEGLGPAVTVPLTPKAKAVRVHYATGPKAVSHAGGLRMPPKEKLSAHEIAGLTDWIARGAVWPAPGKTPRPPGRPFAASAGQRRWWAFRPPRPVTVPEVKGRAWAQTDLDRFILAELETRSLSPAAPAEHLALLRRATFGLTGLPPTPEEADAFLKGSPDAFAKLVDRLLASPAHGERWARHWLDVVRYADFHDGNPATRTASCEPLNAWRYRDWVVRALNADLPFDRFIVHQIAGDLLPDPGGGELYADGLVATTFLTNGSWDRGDADKEKMVGDMVDDQVDTVGKAFLGLTLGCARCHDHKFDPVSQADYYGLAGIFYSTRILKELGAKGGEYTLQRIPLVPKAYLAKRDEQVRRIDEINAKISALDKKKPRTTAEDEERSRPIGQRTRLQADQAVRGRWLVAQETAPAHPAVGDLPAGQRRAARACRPGPGEPLAGAVHPPAAGGRGWSGRRRATCWPRRGSSGSTAGRASR